jgi:hypothetical protein
VPDLETAELAKALSLSEIHLGGPGIEEVHEPAVELTGCDTELRENFVVASPIGHPLAKESDKSLIMGGIVFSCDGSYSGIDAVWAVPDHVRLFALVSAGPRRHSNQSLRLGQLRADGRTIAILSNDR